MTNTWPKQDFSSMVTYYGNVGENTVKLILPYPMRLSWDTTKTIHTLTCHAKVHDSLGRILADILKHYGSEDNVKAARMDLFGGCLNVRKVRGGNAWSIHSWGCAIDLDPDHNTMQMHREQAAMPKEVIDIFKKENWVSMGEARNFDFMHFQAAVLG
ncbi:MAG: M15 family metallopeptidase [Gallionellaceae bacterium]